VTASYTDGQGAEESITSAATAEVSNTNDEPTGTVTITGTAQQGQTLTASHTLNDADGLGTIVYEWSSSLDGVNWVSIRTGGSLLLTQTHVNQLIKVTATYTDLFGTIESVESAITTAVLNVNDAPVAVDDSISVNEDELFVSSIDLDVNDTDLDGDTLSVLAGTFTTVQGGTLILLNDGSYTYMPLSNFYGTDTVDYTVTDGQLTDVGTLTILVAAVNDAPSLTAQQIFLDKQPILRTTVNTSVSEWGSRGAFAALKLDGTVLSWGNSTATQGFSGVLPNLVNVKQVYSNYYAFAALKNDGSVVTWGSESQGGDRSAAISATAEANPLSSGVVDIASTWFAFAALKNDGSVVTWGLSGYGNDMTYTDVSSQVIDVRSQLSSGVVKLYASNSAFAALKSDGSVVSWGNATNGGDSALRNNTFVSSANLFLDSGVVSIVATSNGFAALKNDGTVVSWGYGGSNQPANVFTAGNISEVTKIFANLNSFAAIKTDGSVVAWGDLGSGGDISSVSNELSNPSNPVVEIFSGYKSFAALRQDGSLVTWGHADFGANSSSVSAELASVKSVVSTGYNYSPAGGAFAALKSDGSVVTWGNADYGGDASAAVGGSLSSGVQKVFANSRAFAALKVDGSVVTWGAADAGGDLTYSYSGAAPSSVASQLTSGVKDIYINDSAFVALKDDGSVVTWGSLGYGIDTPQGNDNADILGLVDIYHQDERTEGTQETPDIYVEGHSPLRLFAKVAVDAIEPNQPLKGFKLRLTNIGNPGLEYFKVGGQEILLTDTGGSFYPVVSDYRFDYQVTTTVTSATLEVTNLLTASMQGVDAVEFAKMLSQIAYGNGSTQPSTSLTREITLLEV
ncbi:MAG: cadherin-like domain-containing protein, partial [Thiotrichales bacterium]|nr:cadherin-like domain-containing protein [Thiotrichales bacterium]